MNTQFYFAIFLPIAVIYLLLIFSTLERKLMNSEVNDRIPKSLFFNLRDAFLAILVLDIYQMFDSFSSYAKGESHAQFLITPFLLFTVHFTFYIHFIIKHNYKKRESTTALKRISTLYIVTLLLLTNAVTVNNLLHNLLK